MARRVLVVTTDCGVGEDGTYRPGGLQLFSRLVVRALAESTRLGQLGVLSLLRQPAGDGRDAEDAAGTREGAWARADDARVRREPRAARAHLSAAALAVRPRALPAHQRRAPRDADAAVAAVALAGRDRGAPTPGAAREVRRAQGRSAAQHLGLLDQGDAAVQSRSAGCAHRSPVGRARRALVGRATRRRPRHRQYQAATRDRAVLVVARLAVANRYKGHDQLVDAWPRVVASQPDAMLWIVGEGDDASRLRERVSVLPEPARQSGAPARPSRSRRAPRSLRARARLRDAQHGRGVRAGVRRGHARGVALHRQLRLRRRDRPRSGDRFRRRAGGRRAGGGLSHAAPRRRDGGSLLGGGAGTLRDAVHLPGVPGPLSSDRWVSNESRLPPRPRSSAESRARTRLTWRSCCSTAATRWSGRREMRRWRRSPT